MKIRLAENFRAVFYAPFYATQALGFFAREGLDVELVGSSGPGDAVPRLLDGSIDVTWGGPMRVMKARDQDSASPLACFGEVVARDPFYLVGRPGLGAFDLPDLARLRFAAVSEVPTPWMCLQQDLRDRDVDPDALVRAPARAMADNYAALRSGDLDVVQVFEPFVSMAEADGAEILYAASARGPTVYTTFIAARAGIARHRDAFAAMVRATRRMQDWLAAHSGEELAEVAAPFFPDVPRGLLARSLARYRAAGIWSQTTDVSHAGFARLYFRHPALRELRRSNPGLAARIAVILLPRIAREDATWFRPSSPRWLRLSRCKALPRRWRRLGRRGRSPWW
jgi:NitT/TauT family transport system substrate-binding protein